MSLVFQFLILATFCALFPASRSALRSTPTPEGVLHYAKGVTKQLGATGTLRTGGFHHSVEGMVSVRMSEDYSEATIGVLPYKMLAEKGKFKINQKLTEEKEKEWKEQFSKYVNQIITAKLCQGPGNAPVLTFSTNQITFFGQIWIDGKPTVPKPSTLEYSDTEFQQIHNALSTMQKLFQTYPPCQNHFSKTYFDLDVKKKSGSVLKGMQSRILRFEHMGTGSIALKIYDYYGKQKHNERTLLVCRIADAKGSQNILSVNNRAVTPPKPFSIGFLPKDPKVYAALVKWLGDSTFPC